jgi:4-hydroxy-4-methyl-2-oxoglutarate aldolase
MLLESALVASAAGNRGAAVPGYAAAWPEAHALGRALTVRGARDDNLALHRAIDDVSPGEVIVLDAGGPGRTGLCGDILALAAQRRRAGGLVVNGCVRDLVGIARLGFPVFHRGTSPVAARKDVAGELRVPLELEGVPIQPGDLVVADVDGIFVVPAGDADAVLAEAEALAAREDEFRRRIEGGEATLDLLGLRGRLS